MKNELFEMVFILDRSGSMQGLEKDTIGGFNSMIEKQKQIKGDVLVSTILFNHSCDVIHHRCPIHEIKSLTEKEYITSGMTALLDAIGRSIDKIISICQMNPIESKHRKVMFIIITDGMENASKKYTHREIKKMITYQKEKYGWEFIFLGANIDAVEVARNVGIDQSRTANFHSDQDGIELNFKSLHEAVKMMRTNQKISDDWLNKINLDYKNRSK
jgi:uncharacterized protein YegL